MNLRAPQVGGWDRNPEFLRRAMRRRGILGIGATVAAAAAFFLHPHKGAGRRLAVKRGGGQLVRQGAGIAGRVGGPRRQESRIAELRSRIEDALLEALGPDGFSLRVVAGDDGTITVRGEVRSLEQITAASRVIEGLRGDADVANLVRLRAADPSAAAAG